MSNIRDLIVKNTVLHPAKKAIDAVPNMSRIFLREEIFGPVFQAMWSEIQNLNPKPDIYVGTEPRGYALAIALSVYHLEYLKQLDPEHRNQEHFAGSAIIRKRKGSLDGKVARVQYEPVEGTLGWLEIQEDILRDIEAPLGRPLRILFVDDLLGSARTAEAVVRLIRSMRMELIGALFLAEQQRGGRQLLIDAGVPFVKCLAELPPYQADFTRLPGAWNRDAKNGDVPGNQRSRWRQKPVRTVDIGRVTHPPPRLVF
jgi:adenine/guanine phosphoribosyltransferase-like PRPP-binding protein